ncbi:uncharacterized protein LOC135685449 isoform X3 [Rhopilema esculentum]|uniref:uncharacterized protein LOC135685449 isoform X3 n=1 Tax=Rhopilema esculentum TaxID=499914 RepID=UPI0031DD01DF
MGHGELSDGESDVESRRLLVAELRKVFPDCSEELILELTYEHHQDIDQITEVLKEKSSHFKNRHHGAFLGMTSQGGNSYFGQEKHLQVANSQGNPQYYMQPYYTLPSEPGYHRYNYTDEHINPATSYLQRRAISSDRLTNRRTDVSDIRRERSASDVTHSVGEPMLRSYGPPYPFVDPGGFSAPHRPQRMDSNSIEHDDDHVIQRIQLQKESLARMKTKFETLRNDVARIRQQIAQEEQDLNTTSKVQRNPTEKDVLKLRQEIEILKREVLEANSKLENARAVNNSPPSSIHMKYPPIGIPEERPPETFSVQPMNEFKPASFSPQSGPRFPHPQTPQNLPTNIPARQSEPYVGTPQRSQGSPQNPIGNIADNQEYDKWSCSLCTLDNHPDLQECEACGSKR